MNVLIVENDARLGEVWCDHINRFGVRPSVVTNQSDAVEALSEQSFDVLILNLNLHFGSAMAVADYASYRRPDMKVIFVSSDSFFSDGSIFNYMSNACAMVPRAMPPEDLAALVDYHAR